MAGEAEWGHEAGGTAVGGAVVVARYGFTQVVVIRITAIDVLAAAKEAGTEDVVSSAGSIASRGNGGARGRCDCCRSCRADGRSAH